MKNLSENILEEIIKESVIDSIINPVVDSVTNLSRDAALEIAKQEGPIRFISVRGSQMLGELGITVEPSYVALVIGAAFVLTTFLTVQVIIDIVKHRNKKKFRDYLLQLIEKLKSSNKKQLDKMKISDIMKEVEEKLKRI